MNWERRELVFSRYAGIYEEIFQYIYPSIDSTGFGERNLSVNFSKAYEAVAAEAGEKALSWFEFQFGPAHNLHVDAVILNDTAEELLIVESKRFSMVQKKSREIKKDIGRIYELVSQLREENGCRIDLSKVNRCYGVILADVWPENPRKERILESYQAGVLDPFSPDSFLNQYCYSENAISNQEFPSLTYKVQGLKEGEWATPYYLMSFLWEVSSLSVPLKGAPPPPRAADS